MSQQMRAQPEPMRPWVTGFAIFAGVTMIIIGIFQILTGIAAIVRDQFFVVTDRYVYDIDTTVWGWVHLGVGILVFLAGFGVISRQTWARVVGIVMAGLSAIANFLFIPYYPLWSMLVIALDVLVICALAVYREPVAGRRTD